MLIQFMFMRDIFPRLKLSAKRLERAFATEPKGDLAKYIKMTGSKDARRFFGRYPTYAPHLYTDRGRVRFELNSSRQMGLMLSTSDALELPMRHQAWYPDCLCNVADLNSNYGVFAATLRDLKNFSY